MTPRDQDGHSPPAGAYPTGRAGAARHWDGHAWAGPTIPDDAAPDFLWHRRPWALPAHPLFWVTVGGIAVGCGLALWALHGGGTAVLAAAGLFGSGGPMIAFVLFVARRLRLPQVIGVGEWVMWAVLGAVVAGPIAYVLEGWLPNEGAWQGLAGPIEETSKILVPVVLFLVGRYRDPRAGVALAVGIGAIFGVAEGIEYVIDAEQSGLRVHHPDSTTHLLKEYAPLAMVLERSFMELLHPLLAGFVAAVAWRQAWVRGRFWLPLIGAWVVAAALHGFIDSATGMRAEASTFTDILVLIALAVVVLTYPLVFRRAAAQLPPPDALADNSPPWRPTIPETRPPT